MLLVNAAALRNVAHKGFASFFLLRVSHAFLPALIHNSSNYQCCGFFALTGLNTRTHTVHIYINIISFSANSFYAYLYLNSINKLVIYYMDRLCGLVVRVSGYRYRGPGFDPRRYQIF